MSETANKPKVDYSKIFDIYELNRKTREQKSRIRKNIKYQWEKYLKENCKEDQTWQDLSEGEQTHFICYYINKIMKKECPDERTMKKIEKNIEEYVSGTLLESGKIVKTWNESVDNIYTRYCNADDFEHKNLLTKVKTFWQVFYKFLIRIFSTTIRPVKKSGLSYSLL